ncbi:ATP-binding protein [Sphaerisporangium sp. B11E5]|uniref:ATP-binding protein n=1 Tax=Sphaerisporangium sp. B11E5 TaxID=3153563 RepID=UPI00325EA030
MATQEAPEYEGADRRTHYSDRDIQGRLLGATHLAGSPESVARARNYVRQKLGDNHPALGDVTLLVSELVTNAVVHSNSRNGGRVTLALADCHDRIHADVVDEGGDFDPHVDTDRLAEGGRGLFLVQAISDRWGVHTDHTSRTVWFQVSYERGDTPATPGRYLP